MTDRPADNLFIWNGLLVFIGTIAEADLHRHHLLQIVLSLDGSFHVDMGDGWQTHAAAILAPDSTHLFDGGDARLVIILIEPESSLVQHITRTHLEDTLLYLPDHSTFMPILEKLADGPVGPDDCRKVRMAVNRIIETLGVPLEDSGELDTRIAKAIGIMQDQPDKKISTRDLAARVYLSEGRLIHLFKEQVGLPVRRYLLWLRLMDALRLIFDGRSFTEAAHATGFADSAHMSRTFRQTFGLAPSMLFKSRKDSRFVQVFPCPGW